MLRQAFAHCAKFLTAASRRSMGRVAVPLWLIILSDQLPVIALVSRYLTNKLIGRRFLLRRIASLLQGDYGTLAPISRSYFPPKGRYQRVTHPFATASSPTRHAEQTLIINAKQRRKGLRQFCVSRLASILRALSKTKPYDLHVLSTPPAFILSQDQTLKLRFLIKSRKKF